jgi:excisionase family DNA binding protein
MSDNTEKLTYNVEDLIELLGVGRVTAYQLVKRKDFPKIHIGKRILIPKAGLMKWMQEQSQK